MGGGDSGPTQSTTYTSSLPEYAQPYYEHMLNAAEQEVNQPYTPYMGPRVAGNNQMQQAYYTGLANMGPAYPVLEGQDATRAAMGNAASNAGYSANGISSLYTGAPQYNVTGPQFNSVNAGQVGWNNWNGAAANQYMNPYQQYVTDQQKQSAIVDYGRQRNARNDAAIKSKAFGGDRQGVMESLGEEGLLNRLNTIQGQGLNDAYMNAQGQFNTDRQTGLGAAQFNVGQNLQGQLANQSMGLNYWNAGEQANQFGANFNDASNRYYNDAQMQAALQSEQMAQGGQNINQAWNAQAMQGGQQLGGLGELFQNLEGQRLSSLGQAGQQQQNQAQKVYDQTFQDFVNQRDYGRNNIAWISALLHGLPTGTNSQSDTIGYTSPMATALGAGIGASGLSKALGS
jgi:hypothetical protein